MITNQIQCRRAFHSFKELLNSAIKVESRLRTELLKSFCRFQIPDFRRRHKDIIKEEAELREKMSVEFYKPLVAVRHGILVIEE